MSDTEPKKLVDLRVVDLKAELERRKLDKSGVKRDLQDRLSKALLDEGHDPEIYVFHFGIKKPARNLSISPEDEPLIEKNVKELDQAISVADDDDDDDDDDGDGALNPNENGQAPTQNIPQTEQVQNLVVSEMDTSEFDVNVVLNEDEDMEQNSIQEVNSMSIEEEKTHPENTDEISKKESQVGDGTKTTSTKESTLEDLYENTLSRILPDEYVVPQKKTPSNPRLLWISNVPKNTRANELKQLLTTCGKVVCAKVVVNARFPGSCCFGYVTMGTAEDADSVITKLNNTEFNGQIIKIDKFQNIKADSLNPLRKRANNDEKKSVERKDDKKKAVDDKGGEQPLKDNEKRIGVGGKNESERRKSRASDDRSSRGRRRTLSQEPDRERVPYRGPPRGPHRPSGLLTFDKIKQERERQRLRDRERAMREDNRRRHEEEIRLREMRELTKRQRNEAERLEREREKLRMERDRIEREKSELLKLERERQKIEREKLEMERIELQRSRQRLEEDRRAVKRPITGNAFPYKRTTEEFEERKRGSGSGGGERHYDEPHFEPPPHISEPIAAKKFITSKDYKRIAYEKQAIYNEKRRQDYEGEHNEPSSLTRSNMKFDRSYESIKRGGNRELPAANVMMGARASKEGRYVDRERSSPHFRPVGEERERHSNPQLKGEREHRYSDTNESNRFERNSWSQVSPQSKQFGSGGQKSWNKGSTWRSETVTSERWNSSQVSSTSRGVNQIGGTRGLSQQFSGNSNSTTPTCPPPPGINNYSEQYSKINNLRKY